MKVTSIKQQVKRVDRYSIYIDGRYSFSLGEVDLVRSGLHSGIELNQEELSHYQDDSKLGKLKDRVLNLLSYRPRSEWELRDYMKRKKHEPGDIEKILNMLSNNGYVDDRQFASRWVENRRLLKPISRRKLQAELRQKHIATEIITEVLAADNTDEQEVLRQLVQRKAKRYPDRQKFMRYLAGQGYSYDDIKTVLSEADT